MRKASDLRKAEIVATILELADRIGPDRVTTGAVAAAVGVTQAAVFRHFPTKAELWNAVATHVAAGLTAAWEAALVPGRAPVERLTALVGAQLERIAAAPAMPMLLFSRELNVDNAALRATFKGLVAAFQHHLMREITAAQAPDATPAGPALRTDVAAADVAVLLTSLVQGVAIRWSLGARDFDLQAEGLRLLAAQVRLLEAREG